MLWDVVECAVRAEENQIPAGVDMLSWVVRWLIERGANRVGSGSSGMAPRRPERPTWQRRAGDCSSSSGVYFAVLEAG